MAEVNKLNMAHTYAVNARIQVRRQEMTHVKITLVNLLITKIYDPVIRRVLPKESVHCMEL